MSRKPVKKRNGVRAANGNKPGVAQAYGVPMSKRPAKRPATDLSDAQLLADAERQLQKYLAEKGSRIVGNTKQM